MGGKLALIAGSLFFYGYGDFSVLKIFLISIALNYLFSIGICRLKWKKIFTAVPIVINVGLLLYFKYTDFLITNINTWFGKDNALLELTLPIGISFFTFQQIAYVVSVYRGAIGSSVIDYLVYITYFPKILMGPLVEPSDFYEQLNDSSLKKINIDNIASGIKLFSFGLFKKLLLADTFASAVSWGYTNIATATAKDWLFIMLFYTFEIYFDFSGYSDMATGASLLFNITLPINFDSPYKAISIRDFWKRWHISLTRFFTKYIYIPLGGSRKGIVLTCVNTMIVFLVSGLWHGANWTFILWGALHGAFSVMDRLFDKAEKKIFEPVRWFAAFAAVNVLWLLFRSDTIEQWYEILKTILKQNAAGVSDGLINIFKIAESDFLLKYLPFLAKLSEIRGFWMLLFTSAAFGICLIPENAYRNRNKFSLLGMLLAAAAFIWSFTCFSSESVFVYFNF